MLKIKITTAILTSILVFRTANGQSIEKYTGSYIKIDSTSKKYEKDGVWHADIDTTLLILNKDMTFSYKWSPMFGPYSNTHIITNGKWKVSHNKIILNSKYQEDEYKVIEKYKPEYGDSIVKIGVQTYDSLIGFLNMQYIGVKKDKTAYSKMIFPDSNYNYRACTATFKLSSIDKIVFYGEFGRMPAIIPKNKKSNYFLLQYNLSTNWDYQYFKDFVVSVNGNKVNLGKKKYELELNKI